MSVQHVAHIVLIYSCSHLAENASFITDIFCGQLVSTIQCSECKTNSFCFDPFYDISLPLPKGKQPARQNRYSGRSSILGLGSMFSCGPALSECSLDDCLREFTSEEVLDGENMIECSNCRCKRASTKKLQVYKYPQILVLHLKRFGNSRKKVKTAVQFPKTSFDASPLAYQDQADGSRPIYDLYGVCDHIGSHSFGHYTSSAIDPMSEEWMKFNDECVSSVNPSNLDESSAYMLFYSLREK